MKIWALIPARSGSKGVKDKNIKELCGKPLLNYSIEIASKSKYISRVVLDTDSIAYQKIGNNAGADIPFLRPKELSQDTSTDHDLFRHVYQVFLNNPPDLWVHLRPTTPIRDVEIINAAIEHFIDDRISTSLRSGHLCSESPYKWFLKDDLGYAKPICDHLDFSELNQSRQLFPKVFVPNGYVDLIKNSQIPLNSLHGEKIRIFQTPYAHEVDTIDDFKFIEFQMMQILNSQE